MTVLIKIGRRIPRKDKNSGWFKRNFRKLRNFSIMQKGIWSTIEYGLKLSTIKMKQYQKDNPNILSFSKNKYIEEESLNYDIEWIEIIIDATPEMEEEEYQDTLKFYSSIEDSAILERKKNGDLEPDENLSAEYKGKLKKGKIKKILDAGYEKVKGISISKSLNDIGILTIAEKYSKKEIEEVKEE